MNLIAYVVLAVIIICLAALRYHVVMKEAEEWNYRVHRFEYHCNLHGIYDVIPNENRLTPGQILFVFLMFWKYHPRYFFDNCPDWAEIDDLIQKKQI